MKFLDNFFGLKLFFRQSHEAQKEMSVLLNMYKVIPKDQRDKATLLQAEAKLRAELSESRAELSQLQTVLSELQHQMTLLQKRIAAENLAAGTESHTPNEFGASAIKKESASPKQGISPEQSLGYQMGASMTPPVTSSAIAPMSPFGATKASPVSLVNYYLINFTNIILITQMLVDRPTRS